VKVFGMTSRPPSVHDFRFRDNIRDAADSAERNFPEGFGKFSRGDFARFLDHSRASLLEVKNELAVGKTRDYFSEDDTADATRLTNRALGLSQDCNGTCARREPKRTPPGQRSAHPWKKRRS
jgi:four helix bundle protein